MTDLVMQLRTNITILAKNKAAALAAIKKMPGKERDLDLCAENHFAYIDFDTVDGKRVYLFENSVDLVQALLYWHWYAECDGEGNINKLTFYGLDLGDSDILFSVIAPWVEDGSFIEFANEEGARFRFDFSGGKVRETKLKKIPRLGSTDWDKFWTGKAVAGGYFIHSGKNIRQVHKALLRGGKSLAFSDEEIAAQTYLELVSGESVFVFAPKGTDCFVFLIEVQNIEDFGPFPFLRFVCKLVD